ncbi:MAG: Chemotaxis response regulator protein-glutamate methylesterase CheB [Moraxellaceae bacterium]|jgi:chemotaxis response regulator CheB|nr:Chemotaxis response regulator protein-glutamate methylesterase CheB [Moraxellaceae bacterium]MDF3031287.1 Chemotaxis response regulator protein-glutamate methylesterase CheB [Moraxellaceae bacterium]
MKPARTATAQRPRSATVLVAIGASAGGPSALAEVLGGLPAGFAAAVVVIQHVDEQFSAGLAEWLDQHCALPVRLARDGELPLPGSVLVAGTNDHLVMSAGGCLLYTPEPKEAVYRPSVDAFFESASRHWPGAVVGVLLTGMGRDGARGLRALREGGHHTIAQDEASSAVYGMPKAAALLDAAVEILPLDGIAPRLARTCAARA